MKISIWRCISYWTWGISSQSCWWCRIFDPSNVGSRLVWWFWLIKSLGKIIQNPAIDLMVLINKKFAPGESQISHTNSLSCSCHAPTTTTTTTTPTPPPLHHQQLPSWKANLFLKKNDHKTAQGLVEKPCPFFKTTPNHFFKGVVHEQPRFWIIKLFGGFWIMDFFWPGVLGETKLF